MNIAITRQVSRSINECELTFLERSPIDLERARRQHAEYESALKGLGVAVLSLPEAPDLPDSVFVEDTALVFDECAIITNPGAASRHRETEPIEAALRPYRSILRIDPPARLDGGDVIAVGKDIYVGLSSRSDTNAMEQVYAHMAPFGYRVHAVEVRGCLHLKSAVTQVAQDTLLANPDWVQISSFQNVKVLTVEASEPYAANAVLVDGRIVYASAFPRTRSRLEAIGIPTVTVDADELAKAEGAVTCCSLLFKTVT
jgi:dimethylargininase